MGPTTTIDILNGLPPLDRIFNFCTPKDNATRNALVWHAWREPATRIAKLQLVQSRIKEIQKEAEPFLRMVPLKLELLCASYRNFLTVSEDLSSHTFQEVKATVNTCAEKYTVCLSRFFHIHSEDPNIPELRRSCLSGKVFVEIHHEVDIVQYDGRPKSICQFEERTGYALKKVKYFQKVKYFPIELFNLTMDGEFNIIGEKNNGTFCFPLRGRLIELVLEENTPEVQFANFTGFPHTQRTNAMTLPLTAQDANRGKIWAEEIYCAPLDSQVDSEMID